MNRSTVVLGVLGAVLLAVVFYFFAWKPKSDRIAEIDEEIATVQQETERLEQRVARLKEVRANAPEVEAEVVAAESIVPRDIAMPALLRQMQLAADESGADLATINAARPVQVSDATPGLAEISITVQISGGYYQLVDFFRRVEDPAITARGAIWNNVSIAGGEAYPTLNATVSGSVYSLLPTPPEDVPEEDGDRDEEVGAENGEPTEGVTEEGGS